MKSESNVEWLGASVKIKDVKALLASDEMQKDLEAVKRLQLSGVIKYETDSENDIIHQIYEDVALVLEPYIIRDPNSKGFLPDSVLQSVQMLLEYRLQNPPKPEEK